MSISLDTFFFTSTIKIPEFNCKKVLGNADNVDQSKVVCLLEEHGAEPYHIFEEAVLSQSYETGSDLILVECNRELKPTEIIEQFSKKFPGQAKFLEGKTFRGWDHPMQKLWEDQFKKENQSIISAVENLQDVENHNLEVILSSMTQLSAVHNLFNKEGDELRPKDFIPYLVRKDFESEEFTSLRNLLVQAGKRYTHIKLQKLILETFPMRQQSLMDSVAAALKERKYRRIFVIAGLIHFNSNVATIEQEVRKLLDYLDKTPFIALTLN